MAIYLGREPCLCADCFNSGWIFIVAEVRIVNFETLLFTAAVI